VPATSFNDRPRVVVVPRRSLRIDARFRVSAARAVFATRADVHAASSAVVDASARRDRARPTRRAVGDPFSPRPRASFNLTRPPFDDAPPSRRRAAIRDLVF
jgi:hypothetical protein